MVTPIVPQSFMSQPAMVSLASSSLPDPITAKDLDLELAPVDKLLAYNACDHFVQGAKTLTVTLPKTIWKGLAGDKDFNFSDAMLLAKVPYYLGGLGLVYSRVAGRAKHAAAQQAVGVGLYYLGVSAANQFINTLYRWRYGVDLGLQYRGADGRIRDVFSSSNFPRFDLLSKKQYSAMQAKMGIRPDVADPKEACQEQLRRIINTSRANKLIIGNLLAALGAGYVAGSPFWGRLLGHSGHQTLKTIWTEARPQGLGFFSRVGDTVKVLGSLMGPAWGERGLQGIHPSGSQKLAFRSAVGLLAGGLALTAWECFTVLKPKRYETVPVPRLQVNPDGSVPPYYWAFRAFQVHREKEAGG